MSFDEIMNYMSDFTKREIFTCSHYNEYRHVKENFSNQQLRTKYNCFWEDFMLLDSFKEKVQQVHISNQLLLDLETKYKINSHKLKNKL